MNLPKKFEERMKILLGQEEYKAYKKSLENKPNGGIRINTLKISPEDFEKISPFYLEKIPWTNNGYYYPINIQPAKHPYYYAGLYYIQEPSAMAPAAILPISKGDKVLDLCAAPGGKSTELAAKLCGEGVLIANDISASRAKALLKNLELFGVKNVIVTNEFPQNLEKNFYQWFDKILVDAPCSGEGMFRKDLGMQKAWEKQGPQFYHKLQKDIVVSAANMLKPGGQMLYSTCTFSPEENEGTISYLLEQCPELTLEEIPLLEGFDIGRPRWGNGLEILKKCVRIWPHKVKGEGHFLALLTKSKREVIDEKKAFSHAKVEISKEAKDFLSSLCWDFKENHFYQRGNRIYAVPNIEINQKGLHILKPGLFLGEEKKNRFEPSQALASALSSHEYPDMINFSSDNPNTIRYLKGETITLENEQRKGWKLVCVDGFALGWGKLNQGMLKNKYCASWRWM